jgi:hypothetical protein
MSSKLHDSPRHRRPGRGGTKFLAAGALGSAAVVGGTVAALAGHTGSAPVPAKAAAIPARAAAIPARAAAIPATLTGDVLTLVPADPVVGPYVSYQPPASNGLAGVPYRLGPGSTIVSEDGQQAYTVQSDGSVQYSDTDGNVGSVSNGSLQLPGGGLITFPGQQESDPGTGYPFSGLVQKASLTSGDQGQDLTPQQQQIDQAFGAVPPSATQSQQESSSAAPSMVSQTDPTQATTPGAGQQSANQQATSQQATSQQATSQRGLSQPGTSGSGGAANAGQGTSTAAGNSSTIGNTSAGFTSTTGFTSGGFTSTPGSVTTSGTFSS